jgi:hypothetical protein
MDLRVPSNTWNIMVIRVSISFSPFFLVRRMDNKILPKDVQTQESIQNTDAKTLNLIHGESNNFKVG